MPGKFMYTADTLSRNYDSSTGEKTSILEEEVEEYVHGIIEHIRVDQDMLVEIREETLKDAAMKRLAETILVGWPEQ